MLCIAILLLLLLSSANTNTSTHHTGCCEHRNQEPRTTTRNTNWVKSLPIGSFCSFVESRAADWIFGLVWFGLIWFGFHSIGLGFHGFLDSEVIPPTIIINRQSHNIAIQQHKIITHQSEMKWSGEPNQPNQPNHQPYQISNINTRPHTHTHTHAPTPTHTHPHTPTYTHTQIKEGKEGRNLQDLPLAPAGEEVIALPLPLPLPFTSLQYTCTGTSTSVLARRNGGHVWVSGSGWEWSALE